MRWGKGSNTWKPATASSPWRPTPSTWSGRPGSSIRGTRPSSCPCRRTSPSTALTYYPLTGSAVTWVELEDIKPQDTVVVLGQGLVGNLILQVIRENGVGRAVAVDALANRCAMAAECGADTVINAREEDPVRAVKRLTNGLGADIVIYAVGGPAGPAAFGQGLDMLAIGGLMHLIGLYEDQPLSLPSNKIQGRKILGGYYRTRAGARQSRRAMELLASGAIRTDRMTTHRFPWHEAADAFALLYQKPGEALGVLLDWRD